MRLAPIFRPTRMADPGTRPESVIQRYWASDKPHSDGFFGDWLRTGDIGHLTMTAIFSLSAAPRS